MLLEAWGLLSSAWVWLSLVLSFSVDPPDIWAFGGAILSVDERLCYLVSELWKRSGIQNLCFSHSFFTYIPPDSPSVCYPKVTVPSPATDIYHNTSGTRIYQTPIIDRRHARLVHNPVFVMHQARKQGTNAIYSTVVLLVAYARMIIPSNYRTGTPVPAAAPIPRIAGLFHTGAITPGIQKGVQVQRHLVVARSVAHAPSSAQLMLETIQCHTSMPDQSPGDAQGVFS